jgi:hypothetical protein
MEDRLGLISDLTRHDNSVVARCAREAQASLHQEIIAEREWEARHNREQDESFE